mmetsp:Transcript_16077/g.41315  ORF Transcript_16077/g.41315 Transcript_16077/m.41315 type:complete len:229 (-) Transcript_16077:1091-1777(-)
MRNISRVSFAATSKNTHAEVLSHSHPIPLHLPARNAARPFSHGFRRRVRKFRTPRIVRAHRHARFLPQFRSHQVRAHFRRPIIIHLHLRRRDFQVRGPAVALPHVDRLLEGAVVEALDVQGDGPVPETGVVDGAGVVYHEVGFHGEVVAAEAVEGGLDHLLVEDAALEGPGFEDDFAGGEAEDETAHVFVALSRRRNDGDNIPSVGNAPSCLDVMTVQVRKSVVPDAR